MFLLFGGSDFFALYQIIEKYSKQAMNGKKLEKHRGSLIVEMVFSH